MKLELVSFDLCPYVQRSVITLKYKKAPFTITFIDLESPPSWFEEISPLGKVPVLKVDDKTVLFESAVINEFIDETIGTPLHPRDPLERAFARAWIEYGSELFMTSYHLLTERDSTKLGAKKKELFDDLARLEPVLRQGPYFRGSEFSLVDAAYAPLFVRLLLSEKISNDAAWNRIPKVRAWADALIREPAVRDSVVPGFTEKYIAYCREAGSLLY